ncbi:MAG: DUF456 domain-containing protein [Phycisphaerae bacterium]|nr:DUF456 domain-containing protein [Phycisphaerae bacterium]
MIWVIACVLAAATCVGVLMTLLTLPGTWFIVLAALGCQWWRPGTFSWWTLGAASAVCLAAEVMELAAGSWGSRRAGGGRSGSVGALIGTVCGAIAGSLVLPVVGTIVGAVGGAGVGALVAERAVAGRGWGDSARAGGGAAAGRAAAMIIKAGCAALVGAALTIAACVD